MLYESFGHQKKKSPELLGSILQRSLKRKGLEKRILGGKVLLFWKDIVGPQIASQSSAFKFEGSTLFVKVKSPCWRNELFFLKKNIIDRLNQHIKKNLIKDIVFVNSEV